MNRLNQHIEFINKYQKKGRAVNYSTNHYHFPIISQKKSALLLYSVEDCIESKNDSILNQEKLEFNNKIKNTQ
jgi:hypothetical protein